MRNSGGPEERRSGPGGDRSASKDAAVGSIGPSRGRVRPRSSAPSVLAIVVALALAAMAPAGTSRAQTEADIELRTGVLMKIPIHVEDFVYEEVGQIRFEGGETPEDLLVQDLRYSDFFNVSRGAHGAGNPEPAVAPPQGTRAVASASVRRAWGRPVLSGQLRDATTGNRIFSQDYPLGQPPDRWAVHAFSDEIVHYMTGEAGVAQTRIAFIQDYGDTREIHLIDYDGVANARLTRLGTIVLSPDWAPGGDRLVFTSFSSGEAGVSGMALRDGRVWRVSPAGGMSASACWSPDGRKIAFTRSLSGNLEIFLADAGGGNLTRLTYHPSIETSPSFSPDGSQIAFTSDRTGRPQIYVMDREGGNQRRLTFIGEQNDSPDWSPKGDRIAFVSLLDDVFDVCTMRPDGSDIRRLTAGEGNHENPRWAPDGRHLVYSRRTGGDRRIHVMAADGSGKRSLTDGKGRQYNPAWSPTLSLQSVRGLGANH